MSYCTNTAHEKYTLPPKCLLLQPKRQLPQKVLLYVSLTYASLNGYHILLTLLPYQDPSSAANCCIGMVLHIPSAIGTTYSQKPSAVSTTYLHI
jgi:hypothetical protein